MNELKKGLEDHLRDAGDRVEEEIRRAVKYLDEEVVPEVRRNGSVALRTAAGKLRQMADHLDDERRKHEDRGL